ncbi:MAG: hypothetical protein PSV16_09030 [Flavobacterium sp.]|nr:hypothetical protein [Flavobacterium sp.]
MKQFVIILLLFIAALANAQVDRRINTGQGQGPPPKRDQKPFDFVQASTEVLTKQLSLDTFQAAVVKTYIEDYKKDIEALNVLEIPVEAKAEKYQAAKDKMETKILSVLNKDQVVKFNEYKNRKKDKKGKKDKKDKEANIIEKDSL